MWKCSESSSSDVLISQCDMSSGTEKLSVSLSTAAETHEASEQSEIQAFPPAVEVQCSVRLKSIRETLTVGNGD